MLIRSHRTVGRTGWSAVWPLAWRVHMFAGILVAPLLAVLCVTGIAYAFAPELDSVVYHHQLDAATPGLPSLSLAAQVAAAVRAVPRGTVVSVDPPANQGATTAVNMDVPGDSDPSTDTYLTVYVDPATARTQGWLVTVSGRPPLQQWLREFHGTLQLGTVGGLYSELAASWLPLLATGGLILWFLRRRGAARRGRSRRPTRNRLAVWHALTGIVLLAGIGFISVTGLTWSQYAGGRFQEVVDALHGRTPHLTASAPPYAGNGIGIDRAVAAARHAGLVAPLQVTVPHGSGAYLVSEISQSWPMRQDSVAVDPASGRIIGQLDFAAYPLPAKLTAIGIYAHSGTLFGLANQIGLSVFALGLLAVIGLGYRMWWLRRPRGALFARPPAPGAWRRLPPAAIVVGGALLLALCWALPLLGVSLVAFLVADGLIRRLGPRLGNRDRNQPALAETRIETAG